MQIHNIKTEWGLRTWVRGTWGDSAAWSEAARGGTVGIPDCSIAIFGLGWLPVELKDWQTSSGKPIATARPAQIGWHRRIALLGHRSAFLGVSAPGKVVAIPGGSIPDPGTKVQQPLFWEVGSRADFEDLVRRKDFWRQGGLDG